MKTNVPITLNDEERDRLANLLDGKVSKRLATRAEVCEAAEAFVRALVEPGAEAPAPEAPATPRVESFGGNPTEIPATLAEGVDQTELANTIADDFRVAFGFLAISSAKNVPVERLPAPAKLNKKRAKKGRAPLPGYHVLDLGFGRKVERDGGESGRTHASPRLHTRRGHMRQCASGTITYVRPTLVGDPTKGVVSKDYKARIRT